VSDGGPSRSAQGSSPADSAAGRIGDLLRRTDRPAGFDGRPSLIQVLGIYSGATLVAVVGILDDRGLLHHQIKLFVAMPAAAVILLATGIRSQVFPRIGQGLLASRRYGAHRGMGRRHHRVFQHSGPHGRTLRRNRGRGVALLRHFRIGERQILVSTMAAAVLGAAAGFLRWNFKPAKIFMGDGGAMFLGFLMATLALKLRPVMAGGPKAAWLVPIFILGATIFDTTLISISRSRRGFIPFTTPGKDHAAHRLSNLFNGQRSAVLVLYALGAFPVCCSGHEPFACLRRVQRCRRVRHRRACRDRSARNRPYERQSGKKNRSSRQRAHVVRVHLRSLFLRAK